MVDSRSLHRFVAVMMPPATGAEQHEDAHAHDLVMPGFRFHPTEEELIEYYLRRKVEGKHFHIELITSLDLYRYDPWELPGLFFLFETIIITI
jgi:No apical meristem (NAM) protein